MPKEHQIKFIDLFFNHQSCLNSQARLSMAQTILKIGMNQNDERLQAISLITIGEITKSLKTLQEAL